MAVILCTTVNLISVRLLNAFNYTNLVRQCRRKYYVRSRGRNRGVSLIEVLLAATLMAIVLVPVLEVFGFITRQWATQVSRGNSVQDANLAMERMAKNIEQSIAFDVTNAFIMPADTDVSGNYVPRWQSGSLAYYPGTQYRFALSNKSGNATPGENKDHLWRYTRPTGGLLTMILSSWTKDSNWSLIDPTKPNSGGVVRNISVLTFTSVGMPTNMVRASITISTAEGTTTTYQEL